MSDVFSIIATYSSSTVSLAHYCCFAASFKEHKTATDQKSPLKPGQHKQAHSSARQSRQDAGANSCRSRRVCFGFWVMTSEQTRLNLTSALKTFHTLCNSQNISGIGKTTCLMDLCFFFISLLKSWSEMTKHFISSHRVHPSACGSSDKSRLCLKTWTAL